MSYEVVFEKRFLEDLEAQIAWSIDKGFHRWVDDLRAGIKALITELEERPTRYQRLFIDEQTQISYHKARLKTYYLYFTLDEVLKRVTLLELIHERSGRQPNI